MKRSTKVGQELISTAHLTGYQQNLLKRINNIAVSLMPEFEDKKQAMDAVTLDDGSLMQLICSIQMEKKTRASDLKICEVRRRRENLEAFYNSLQELGGILKVYDVAHKLGVTRQEVIFRVKKKQLIAFKQNADYIFPVFQFTDDGLIPGFKEMMSAFDANTHSLLRFGVLKAPIQLSECVSKTPIQIMQDGAKPEELELAIRSARLCGNHAAN
ncbi:MULTISPECIES: DNA-binding protein [unclassified Leclercia]|uniref:DNA-binding protein n=1 Tax=Leclercia barmai TaxID=2785629 RepID=A0ABS7RZ94_9ENTR|nr:MULTISPECIES: DNA-binding protein [unclassified Leclercia]MBZ0059597.1 DNA-binding protein [Leclercia sp. EMC7]MCM5697270.1 DNA-binding protein [Leclercia sp. LTM01]MCM5702134.1 DNA-binding protein [Leclercia sp. LTM14]